MSFERVVVIGFGKIAHECLKIVKNNFKGEIDVIKFEKEFLSNTIDEDKRVKYHQLEKKEDVTSFFLNVSERTLIVSVNNNYLFPKKVVCKENFYIINFHNALLPNYKGRNAQTWVIYKQENKTGVTWHKVNEKVDDGAILYQECCELNKTETALKLTRKLMSLGVKGFEFIFPKLLSKTIKVEKQEKPDSNKIYYSNEIPNNGYLEICWSIAKMSAFLRSINYGIANIFPKPKICILGEEKTIIKYKLTQLDFIIETSTISVSKSKIEIIEGKTKLILYI